MTRVQLLAGQANKALFTLIRKAVCLHYPILSHLFDSLVRPITEYACEVWAFSNADELELVHRRFCKFSLGLPSSTSNLAVYGDLGRVPLMIRRKVTLIKYWLRISTHWDISGLLKEAYQLTLTDSPDKWTTSVKQVLDEAGFSYVWNNPLGVRHNEFISQLLQSLLDQYSQDCGSELLCSRKLRTYRIFKNTLSYEAYLNLPPYL